MCLYTTCFNSQVLKFWCVSCTGLPFCITIYWYSNVLFSVIPFLSTMQFDSIQSNNMENTIREGIALAASTQSGSEISSNAFNIGRLSCRGPGDWLSYRSSIKNTATHTKTQLLGFLEGWVGTSKPTIQLGLFYLNVNSLCSVKISSLTEPECSN